MKYVLSIAAVLCLAGYAVPALASSTALPRVTLSPLSPSAVAAVVSRPGCDTLASIDGTPFFQMPTIAAEQGIGGTAQVKIDITPAGTLTSEALVSSSGNRWLDDAALLSARMSRYTTATIDCQHVGGSYLYDVEF